MNPEQFKVEVMVSVVKNFQTYWVGIKSEPFSIGPTAVILGKQFDCIYT